MFKVAITGGIAAGKSTVCAILQAKGVIVIDADDVAREITASDTAIGRKIITHFGAQACSADGLIDRQKMRQLVFNDQQELAWLNNLVHPAVRKAISRQLNDSSASLAVVSIPLLFENKLQGSYDFSVAVICDEKMQLERACQRDNMTEDLARAIIAQQVSNAERSNIADHIIVNSAAINGLPAKVDVLYRLMLRLAG